MRPISFSALTIIEWLVRRQATEPLKPGVFVFIFAIFVGSLLLSASPSLRPRAAVSHA